MFDDEHFMSTEALDEDERPQHSFAWKVECSCGWSEYCATAEDTQEAIYRHRSQLVVSGRGGL